MRRDANIRGAPNRLPRQNTLIGIECHPAAPAPSRPERVDSPTCAQEVRVRPNEEAIVKPVVDEDMCIGCGNCEDECPDAFRLEADGLARVIGESFPVDLYGCIRDAAASCPVDAISVEE